MNSAWILEDLADSRDWLAKSIQMAFPRIAIDYFTRLGEALAAIRERPGPDLALIDLNLPDGSGIALIEAIKQSSPDTICVVASIFDDDLHLMPALRAGAQGYLLKDQSCEQIADLLRGIADGRPPLSPAIARRLLAHFQPKMQDHVVAFLTQRETEVLSIIAKGMTIAETARLLNISPNTVPGYIKEIYRKLNVSSRAEAAISARNLGLV